MNQSRTIDRLNHQRRRHLIQAVIIILLGGAFRLGGLGSENLSYDEVIIVTLLQDSFGAVLELAANGRPATLLLITYPWVQFFGFSEVAVRMVPAFLGTLSVALFFKLSQRYVSRDGAWLVAALFAASLFHIFYSQDYRYYSFLTFFTLLSYYSYGRALDEGSQRWFVVTALANVCVLYSHSLGIFVPFAQGLHFLIYWRRYEKSRRPWLLHQILAAAGMSWAFWIVISDYFRYGVGETGSTFAPTQHLLPPTFRSGLYTLLLQYPFHGSQGAEIRLGLTIGVLLVFIGLILHYRRRIGQFSRSSLSQVFEHIRSLRTRQDSNITALLLWLVCPLFLPILISQFFGPIYLSRYTIPALPAAYLLMGVALEQLTPILPRRLALLFFLPAIFIALTNHYQENQKDEWQALAEVVTEFWQPGDRALFVSINNEPAERVGDAINYYFRGELENCGDDQSTFPSPEQAESALQGCRDGQRIWLLTRPINDDHLHLLEDTFAWEGSAEYQLLEIWRYNKVAGYLFEVQEP